MRGRPSTYKYALTKHNKIMSKHYTLLELYRTHSDLFKNESHLRNWAAGRSIKTIPRSYRLLKL